jgi:hypothetical protein
MSTLGKIAASCRKPANKRRNSVEKNAGATRTQFFKQNKGLTETVEAV